MAFHRLERKQILPVNIDRAWDFFSNPKNLSLITPPDMNFIIISPDGGKTYPGQIIAYRVSPVFGIPMKWLTEITHVNAPYYFVDSQLHGPYKFWHHQHHFQEHPSGVQMTDVLYYGLPFGIFGELLHALFIRKRIEYIFSYRSKRLEELFR